MYVGTQSSVLNLYGNAEVLLLLLFKNKTRSLVHLRLREYIGASCSLVEVVRKRFTSFNLLGFCKCIL